MRSSRARRRVSAVAAIGMAATLLLVGAGAGGAGAKPKGEEPWVPNDPLFEEQWALQQLRVPAAWQRSTGEGVTIAVLDSGVDRGHEDLTENIVDGRTFVGCPDAAAEDGCQDGDYRSGNIPYFHGTLTAGVAAARGGNGLGIVGVAPFSSLMPVKVYEPASYTAVGFSRAIRWAADHGADVINSSAGIENVEGSDFDVISEAIRYAIDEKGVVFVQAAGNTWPGVPPPLCASTAGPVFKPLGDDGVLCVLATDRRELRAAYSGGPVKTDLLAVSAPGGPAHIPTVCREAVLSTWPGPPPLPLPLLCEKEYSPNYGEGTATSIAAPQVAGVAALLRAMGCTGPDTVRLIKETARNPLNDTRGEWGPVYGYGIVDADAATTAATTQCDATKAKTNKDIL